MNKKVIVLEKDIRLAKKVSLALSDKGLDVVITHQIDDFIIEYDSHIPDIVVLDIEPFKEHRNFGNFLRLFYTDNAIYVKIILILQGTQAQSVKELEKIGAYSIIDKSTGLNINQLIINIDNALKFKQQEEENISLQIENITLKKHLMQAYPFIGESKIIKKIKAQIVKLAHADEDMFVIGETGTGKEIAINYYYQNSNRFGKVFHTCNCSALTETLIESELFGHLKGAFTSADKNKIGYFEKCNNGILFLDEITNLSISAQSKILRAIENKEIQVVGGALKKVDTRLLFASNASIDRLSHSDVFRKDLFFRIEGNIIELPPLRDRGDDIIKIMIYFFSNCIQSPNLDSYNFEEIKNYLLSYSWPGNIRELLNFCKSVMINEKELSNEIILHHLEKKILKNYGNNDSSIHKYLQIENLKDSIASYEREYLAFQLNKFNWHVSYTAKQIGIERTTLYKKIKSYNLKPINHQ